MTESDKAVMQQALDALEGVLDDDKDVMKASISGGLYEVFDCQRSIASLREAIAQPEQTAQSDEEIIKAANIGPVYTEVLGRVERRPEQYRKELQQSFLRGARWAQLKAKT